MLRVVSYDIAEPRRLKRVAKVCQNYGVRVQYSVFECWLEEDPFLRFWADLKKLINTKEDRLVAYTLDQGASRKRLSLGATMVLSDKPTWRIVG